MFGKGKSAVEGSPKNVGVGLKRRRELSKKRLGRRLPWWRSIKKKEASHLLGFRERQVLKPALQSNRSSLYGLHRSMSSRGKGRNGQIVSMKRVADGRTHRSREIIGDEK